MSIKTLDREQKILYTLELPLLYLRKILLCVYVLGLSPFFSLFSLSLLSSFSLSFYLTHRNVSCNNEKKDRRQPQANWFTHWSVLEARASKQTTVVWRLY